MSVPETDKKVEELIKKIIDVVGDWAKKFHSPDQFDKVFLFGSLLRRQGSHFTPERDSDVDILFLFSDALDHPLLRVNACNDALSKIQELEQQLIQLWPSWSAEKPVASVGAIRAFSFFNQMMNWKEPEFVIYNTFLDLISDASGKMPYNLNGSLLLDPANVNLRPAVMDAQDYCKQFLSITANGRRQVNDFNGEDPIPKSMARAAAHVSHYLEPMPGRDPVDLNVGFFFIQRLVWDQVQQHNDCKEYDQLADLIAARFNGRGTPQPLNCQQQLLLWEMLATKAIMHIRNIPPDVPVQQPPASTTPYASPPTREPTIEQLTRGLGVLLRVEPVTRRVMEFAGHATPIAVDRCFEILHSHDYAGWRINDIECNLLAQPVPLSHDLQALVDQNPPDPPNNGKYRLIRLQPDSSERQILSVALAPTDYYSTVPIQRRLYEPVLIDAAGNLCSPWQKYGQDLLDFEHCQLPNIVSLHVIVALPGSKLLITQRVLSGLDWQLGRWSLSFEEQMNSSRNVRPTDRSFFDTIKAGIDEELGCGKEDDVGGSIKDMKVLSLIMDSDALVVDVVALVTVDYSLDEIRARRLLARDGHAELRRYEQMDWTVTALAPVLAGQDDLVLGDIRIRHDEWNITSRMRILAALFHRHGIRKTLIELEDWRTKHAIRAAVSVVV